ncbi:hypothetical protein KC340_g14035 [Hortaea werneckii]|nr:hypothetical protein KC342_g963 [Hortaea werneckii]KAI7108857.1 hypothetical protein KC339_g1215 [Hortaea werneckii]KAI7245730.1 hypothetical protein KC365_g246 [Hortaea werneckii]KAI7298996.1 hypothetical protein KC340_g14035 [Hortaea werneckii]KAI7390121.1 hypothetical protein KC328_g8096 [Hortaea werneckii]
MDHTVNCILLVDGTRVDVADLIGNGSDGFIIRNGHHVLKIPKLYGYLQPDGTTEADSDNEFQSGRLDTEKQVYERLHGVPGIAEFIECTSNGILLKYYPNGALSEYIARNPRPSMSWRWQWILQATKAIAGCHERGILVFDIAIRNFLLADGFSLRLIDFSNSSLVPTGEDFALAEIDGSTAKMDLLHLANVIYSIWVWGEFTVDCAMESEWPDLSSLPELEGFEGGCVIRKCWERKYTAIEEMLVAVRQCARTSLSVGLF